MLDSGRKIANALQRENGHEWYKIVSEAGNEHS
jgi:hypothetical protein